MTRVLPGPLPRPRRGDPTAALIVLALGGVAGLLVPVGSVSGGEPGDTSSARPNERSPHESSKPTIRFNDHIRPILTAHCMACHGGVKQAGDVSFVYRDQVLPPGGWVVQPGDPEASALIERVTSDDPDLRMPPPDHGPALAAEEIDRLRRWIAEGAVWEEPWAFQPPTRSPPPAVSDRSWPRQPLDRFVQARLDAEGLTPTADADPDRWLRRATLDLTGLPPTPEDRERFAAERTRWDELAYARAADRLLASPALGERFASVWLDQMRYADSKGLGLDGRRTAWPYRDWVIDAFNTDMPYDAFTLRQIAGDLLPEATLADRIATTGHRLTQTNEEGGTDDEEFRVQAVLDRVSTTWQAWQGVTFGCVQCHGHPYDPFRHDEFYKFTAFFNNTADCDLDEDWPVVPVPLERARQAETNGLLRGSEQLRQTIWEREAAVIRGTVVWSPIETMNATTNTATRITVDPADASASGAAEFRTVGQLSRGTTITLDAAVPETTPRLTAIRLTVLPRDPAKAVSDSEWGFVLSHLDAKLVRPAMSDGSDANEKSKGVEASGETSVPLTFSQVWSDEAHPFHDPAGSLNAKSRDGFSAYTRIQGPREAVFLLAEPVDAPAGSRLTVALRHDYFILSSFPLVMARGHLAVTSDEAVAGLVNESELMSLRRSLAEAKGRLDRIKTVPVPVLREREPGFERPTHVFIRGLFLTKDEQVVATLPASLPNGADRRAGNGAAGDGGAGDRGQGDGEPGLTRLDLARWLTAEDNPLTARVAVNRLWGRLFEVGLVATEEDFGSSGEVPSHPALLDDLAIRFQHDLAWQTKPLLREIVLSRTYRQDARASAELRERDPDNRLLARGPRGRLSAEAVRDQALALSGLLSRKPYGPPVHPPLPEGVWRPFQAGDKWTTPPVGEEDRYRRTVYTYIKRSIPFPMAASFDAPSREFCTPRRLTSNTPIQALMTLNDVTFQESAVALGRLIADSDADLADRLRAGLERVTCRTARPEEVEALRRLWTTTAEASDEAAAWTAVASVLLNLDDVLMK